MWEISSQDQLFTFLIFFVSGIVLKLFYDVMRAKRKVQPSKNFRVFIFDIIFWIVSGIVTFLLLLVRTNGQARFYTFFGQTLGFVFCHFTVSIIWTKTLIFAFKIFYKILEVVEKTFERINTKISQICSKTTCLLLKYAKKVFKSLKKLLKSRKGMLYTKGKYADVNGSEVVSNEG